MRCAFSILRYDFTVAGGSWLRDNENRVATNQYGGAIMANPFVHVELQTNDLARAKDFYTKLFDWQLDDVPGMDYTMIGVGEGTGGGMMKNPVPNAPSQWLAYVQVDDVVASTEKAKSLGATICKEVTEIPDYGWFSVFIDPTGAALALWQMKK
jgi:predicted enzyme related to lactoylglutathione lyase